ncbi:hypothetical protein [Pseudomonas sp. GM102]|uniref:hypothetical protein n=1 Tax=Pseudomonas sp. GM102 TaxID=1144321 RepID=UPI0015A6396D|nr:hypothetical protein [Pseudomonas sp. GM102]
MRKLFIFFVILMCSACSLNHGKPIATLQYSKIEQFGDTSIYQIYFTSDIAILELFKSRIGEGLVCSLEDDMDFSQAHHIRRSGFGFVERVVDDPQVTYKADVIFRESESGKGGEKYLQGEALVPLLEGRDYFSCVFRVHTTTYKTYFSNIMHVPSGELLKAATKN